MEHKGCEADTAHMNTISCALSGKLLLGEVGMVRVFVDGEGQLRDGMGWPHSLPRRGGCPWCQALGVKEAAFKRQCNITCLSLQSCSHALPPLALLTCLFVCQPMFTANAPGLFS